MWKFPKNMHTHTQIHTYTDTHTYTDKETYRLIERHTDKQTQHMY